MAHVIAGSRKARPPREAPRVHFVEVIEFRRDGRPVGVVQVVQPRTASRAQIIAAAADEWRATTKVRAEMTAPFTGRIIAPPLPPAPVVPVAAPKKPRKTPIGIISGKQARRMGRGPVRPGQVPADDPAGPVQTSL